MDTETLSGKLLDMQDGCPWPGAAETGEAGK